MNLYLSRIRHPFQRQGALSKRNYFEGWYYKQVQLAQDKTISFIFGFSTAKADPHSFIQVIQSNPLHTAYFRFPLDAFETDGQAYAIAKNRFSLNELELHLESDELTVDGILRYSDHRFLDHSLYTPNIMGPFAYVPNMECNHGVVSMSHKVNGTLIVNHQSYPFVNEDGYLEKDWGTSFPKRYIWIQGNHFKETKGSFMASIAHIPFGAFAFQGIIAQLDMGSKRYRFATYNGTKLISMAKTSDGFTFELRKGSTSLTVIAHMPVSGSLKSPKQGAMSQTIKEGLGGSIDLILKIKGQREQRFTSDHCGIELEGYLSDR